MVAYCWCHVFSFEKRMKKEDSKTRGKTLWFCEGKNFHKIWWIELNLFPFPLIWWRKLKKFQRALNFMWNYHKNSNKHFFQKNSFPLFESESFLIRGRKIIHIARGKFLFLSKDKFTLIENFNQLKMRF